MGAGAGSTSSFGSLVVVPIAQFPPRDVVGRAQRLRVESVAYSMKHVRCVPILYHWLLCTLYAPTSSIRTSLWLRSCESFAHSNNTGLRLYRDTQITDENSLES